LKGAGVNVFVVENGFHALWDKAAVLIPFATATTAANCGLGALVASPEAYALFIQLGDELTAVALATGYDVSASLQRNQARLQAVVERAPHFTSSMNRDMNSGKPIELEWLTGKVIQLGDEHSVPVEAHRQLYAVIKARLAERDQAWQATRQLTEVP
jgi:2-dehydropantoate 2-reductase